MKTIRKTDLLVLAANITNLVVIYLVSVGS